MFRARIALVLAALVTLGACTGPAAGPASTLRPSATKAGSNATATPAAPTTAGTVTPPTTAPTEVPTSDTSGLGPPLGLYRCYLVPGYTYLSYVELLSGGHYEAGYTPGEPRTNGSYTYAAASNQVVWSGGDYEEVWPVAYWVQPNVYPNGSKREGTGADRHTIALKVDHSNPRLPGEEVGSNPIYVYCYQEAG